MCCAAEWRRQRLTLFTLCLVRNRRLIFRLLEHNGNWGKNGFEKFWLNLCELEIQTVSSLGKKLNHLKKVPTLKIFLFFQF